MKNIVCYFYVYTVVYSTNLSSIFQKCKLKDQKCLKDALQNALSKLKEGLPNWGVPSIDPLFLPEMTIGGGPHIVQLTQNYRNAYLSGLSDSQITDFKFDLQHMRLVIEFTFREWIFNATYEVGGKILHLPVLGLGVCSMTLENGKGVQIFMLETYKKNDKSFLRGIDGKLDIIPQKVEYHFENLFHKNKVLGDNINKVLNDNWRDVYNEGKHGYCEVYSASFMSIMNRLFSRLPVSEMFIGEM